MPFTTISMLFSITMKAFTKIYKIDTPKAHSFLVTSEANIAEIIILMCDSNMFLLLYYVLLYFAVVEK